MTVQGILFPLAALLAGVCVAGEPPGQPGNPIGEKLQRLVGRLISIDAQGLVVAVPPDAPKETEPLKFEVTDETVITELGEKKTPADLKPGDRVGVIAFRGAARAVARLAMFEESWRILPDFSDGMGGLVGPFFWGRAADLGAEARFCDEYGRPDSRGEFLWLYQFKRSGLKKLGLPDHERNNLVSRNPRLAYEFQPWLVTLNTPETIQVLKLMVGYVWKDHKFQHGDNSDLIHLAATPRVAVFVPIRRTAKTPPVDQAAIDTNHGQAPLGVFELAENETMASGPGYIPVAKRRVLLDLRERFKKEAEVHPNVEKPMFRFTIEGQGKWTLKIELDGRDGLAGGLDDKGWDLVYTQDSPGAKPYTVDLTPENSAWALSIFNPGGPPESSEIVVGLKPFDRSTGEPAPWPSREGRIGRCSVELLARIGAGDDLPERDLRGRLQSKDRPK